MKKFQKFSLSGAVALTVAFGVSASVDADSKDVKDEEENYYYYETDENGEKTKLVDGLTKEELDKKLEKAEKDSKKADQSYYYYEVDEDGNKTVYQDGLTKKELENKLSQTYEYGYKQDKDGKKDKKEKRDYYYYEVDKDGKKTFYEDGLTKKELENKLGHSFEDGYKDKNKGKDKSKDSKKEDDSYYYYEVDEDGKKTEYIDGLTKKELKKKLSKLDKVHVK
ncbi:hypothetical protein [Corticicoccus populi]|uniref:Uncharacterized protein n=1 Tax=Corticicoccus populi TaxID=1812821 RepID=A0ABW5X1A7_9STAP